MLALAARLQRPGSRQRPRAGPSVRLAMVLAVRTLGLPGYVRGTEEQDQVPRDLGDSVTLKSASLSRMKPVWNVRKARDSLTLIGLRGETGRITGLATI